MDEADPLKDCHQTLKLYENIKEWYVKKEVSVDTPFPVMAVLINKCVSRFNRKPPHKVIYLSFKYLDEIGYKTEKP